MFFVSFAHTLCADFKRHYNTSVKKNKSSNLKKTHFLLVVVVFSSYLSFILSLHFQYLQFIYGLF